MTPKRKRTPPNTVRPATLVRWQDKGFRLICGHHANEWCWVRGRCKRCSELANK